MTLICRKCNLHHMANMINLSCNNCSQPLQVEYVLNEFTLPKDCSYKWNEITIPLPLNETSSLLSLGEGHTPTIELHNLQDCTGVGSLYAKLEYLNPTGSFKDRGTAVMMSVANEHNVKEIVEDSSGNAGASVSAYGARSGIKTHIFVPSTAPIAKIQQIEIYGACVHKISGTREETTKEAVKFYKDSSFVYASHSLSPYFIEGTKTFAYEVYKDFCPKLPDHIVIPVGNGGLIIGAWKGFQELRRAGLIKTMPRLHCIQSTYVMPIVNKYSGPHSSEKFLDKVTVAGGISVTKPQRINDVLTVLRQSQGNAIAVTDEEITDSQKLLANKEGLFAEPTSAAAFAGLSHLRKAGIVSRDDTVLVPITGFGLKDKFPVL